ncbi:hypothetical protein BT63DRAFT_410956 [Microthyrium microscopicum]|uniref:SMODS and SLOG-associating 2TM effector domain-containing protein n=1 Tax=Microthyrium microscopicum TaxID=703497 RepID=A0A6A6UL06_9PEZI|nr:hypothetical protein BT63DRAFT_410956 [Microthyrium microscopicum]
MPSEHTPLLGPRNNFWEVGDREDDDLHSQFCKLIGIPPSDTVRAEVVPKKSLYGRALKMRRSQQNTYAFTASLSNTLLLSQVVLGAAVTGLGASESSHILITLFGATNTIIAGVVAYLKSRGQPMRARMFRDDLERVVDEIENSEIMWREIGAGISKGMHGYDEIDIDQQVTVRSEVARLTRLYERVLRTNTANNPDMYQAEGSGMSNAAALKAQGPIPVPQPAPAAAPMISTPAGAFPAAPVAVVAPYDPDESPAIALPKPPPPPGPEASSSKTDSSSSDDKTPSDTDADNKDGSKDLADESKDKAKEMAD